MWSCQYIGKMSKIDEETYNNPHNSIYYNLRSEKCKFREITPRNIICVKFYDKKNSVTLVHR